MSMWGVSTVSDWQLTFSAETNKNKENHQLYFILMNEKVQKKMEISEKKLCQPSEC